MKGGKVVETSANHGCNKYNFADLFFLEKSKPVVTHTYTLIPVLFNVRLK